MSAENKEVVVPVGWFRVAVATQVLMEWAFGLTLLVILKWAAPNFIFYEANQVTALTWIGYLEGLYLAVGALFLLYAGLIATPPTEETFTKTKWWQAWALSHAPLPRRSGSSAGVGAAVGAGAFHDATDVNPANGMPMADGIFDSGGNVWGDSD